MDLEERIISVAREVFLEKGFDGASMSDIAARVGINRPTLHYYYRTKDKMYQAVFISIVQSFTPKIQDTVISEDVPFESKIEKVIDMYLEVALNNPNLPMFIIREVNRNIESFVEAIRPIYMENFFNKVGPFLLHEMECGRINQVPLKIVFNTFYSLLIFPFIMRNLVFMDSGKTLEDSIKEWKPYFVKQMVFLLCK